MSMSNMIGCMVLAAKRAGLPSDMIYKIHKEMHSVYDLVSEEVAVRAYDDPDIMREYQKEIDKLKRR